jgi:hypothetical protein
LGFAEKLILEVADKAVLGLLVLGAGYWLNRKIEQFKSELELRRTIAVDRATAYRDLWKLTQKLGGTGVKRPIDPAERKNFEKELYGWYFDQGNALYLSQRATVLLMKSWPKLKTESDQEVRNHFSSLRTQLKIDCGVISEEEARLGVMPKKENEE